VAAKAIDMSATNFAPSISETSNADTSRFGNIRQDRLVAASRARAADDATVQMSPCPPGALVTTPRPGKSSHSPGRVTGRRRAQAASTRSNVPYPANREDWHHPCNPGRHFTRRIIEHFNPLGCGRPVVPGFESLSSCVTSVGCVRRLMPRWSACPVRCRAGG
jgi:hypothetical protein